MEKDIVTIEEVAKYLRVSERTVYDWAQKGQIPCGKIGTSWRFKRTEILRWINTKLVKSKFISSLPDISLKTVLTPERCCFISNNTKNAALHEMIQFISGFQQQLKEDNELLEAIFQRERLMSTGIGLGIAVPHIRLEDISEVIVALGVSKEPIEDYESLDGNHVHFISMIIASSDQHNEYIRLLADITSVLKKERTREMLLGSETNNEIYHYVMENI